MYKDNAKKQLIKLLLNFAGCAACSITTVILYKSGQSGDLVLSLLMGGFVVCMVQGAFAAGKTVYWFSRYLRQKIVAKKGAACEQKPV